MGVYDEVEIEDMEWNEELEAFTYSCPCGDLFQITLVRIQHTSGCTVDGLRSGLYFLLLDAPLSL